MVADNDAELAIVYDHDGPPGSFSWYWYYLQRAQNGDLRAPNGYLAGPGRGGFASRNEAMRDAMGAT